MEVDIDDYPMVFGIEFLDKAQALMMSFLNSICMMGGDKACIIMVDREAKRKTRHTAGMLIVKGLRKEQPTQIAAIGKLEGDGEVPKTNSYQKIQRGHYKNKWERMSWTGTSTSLRQEFGEIQTF